MGVTYTGPEDKDRALCKTAGMESEQLHSTAQHPQPLPPMTLETQPQEVFSHRDSRRRASQWVQRSHWPWDVRRDKDQALRPERSVKTMVVWFRLFC